MAINLNLFDQFKQIEFRLQYLTSKTINEPSEVTNRASTAFYGIEAFKHIYLAEFIRRGDLLGQRWIELASAHSRPPQLPRLAKRLLTLLLRYKVKLIPCAPGGYIEHPVTGHHRGEPRVAAADRPRSSPPRHVEDCRGGVSG